MRNQGSSIRLVSVACLFAASFSPVAHAGSYTVTTVHYDQGWDLYGLEKSGEVVVLDLSQSLYDTYNGSILVNSSAAAPDPSLLDNGVGCTPGTPAGFTLAAARCNGSLEALDGWNWSALPNQSVPRLYTGTDFLNQQVAVGGGGTLFLNAAGQMAWDDAYTDTIFQATPLATATTPEPSSLLLLVTGAAVLCARRRFVTIALEGPHPIE
jgi:hypothetical protein